MPSLTMTWIWSKRKAPPAPADKAVRLKAGRLPSGTRVRIRGLTGSEAASLNGRLGRVTGRKVGAGKHEVRLDVALPSSTARLAAPLFDTVVAYANLERIDGASQADASGPRLCADGSLNLGSLSHEQVVAALEERGMPTQGGKAALRKALREVVLREREDSKQQRLEGVMPNAAGIFAAAPARCTARLLVGAGGYVHLKVKAQTPQSTPADSVDAGVAERQTPRVLRRPKKVGFREGSVQGHRGS